MKKSIIFLFFILLLLSGCQTSKIALTEQEKDARVKSWRLDNPNPWVILYGK
jgi:hypothetical protein